MTQLSIYKFLSKATMFAHVSTYLVVDASYNKICRLFVSCTKCMEQQSLQNSYNVSIRQITCRIWSVVPDITHSSTSLTIHEPHPHPQKSCNEAITPKVLLRYFKHPGISSWPWRSSRMLVTLDGVVLDPLQGEVMIGGTKQLIGGQDKSRVHTVI